MVSVICWSRPTQKQALLCEPIGWRTYHVNHGPVWGCSYKYELFEFLHWLMSWMAPTNVYIEEMAVKVK